MSGFASSARLAKSRPLVWMCAACIGLAACAPLAQHSSRPSRSSLGCIQRVVAEKVPQARSDAEAHCLATAFVARYCSPAEAFIAGLGKELKDVFTAGDAEWRDLRSDRRGSRCAKSANADAALIRCCTPSGAPEARSR